MSNNVKVKKKSVLKAPMVQDAEVQRAIEKIYEDLNILKDATNIEVGTSSSEHEGKPGDIRLVKESGKYHVLEIRTKDGWKRGKIGGSDIQYISIGSRKKYQPATIDESGDPVEPDFVTEEDLAGENFASQSWVTTQISAILDADYDSGWFEVDNNAGEALRVQIKPHNIDGWNGDSPTKVAAFFKDTYGNTSNEAPTNYIYPWKRFENDGGGGWIGVDYRIDSVNVYIQAYAAYHTFWIYQDMTDSVGLHRYFNAIDGRILIWK
jgi:hypothetical protein